jgi:hypothetical protein
VKKKRDFPIIVCKYSDSTETCHPEKCGRDPQVCFPQYDLSFYNIPKEK